MDTLLEILRTLASLVLAFGLIGWVFSSLIDRVDKLTARDDVFLGGMAHLAATATWPFAKLVFDAEGVHLQLRGRLGHRWFRPFLPDFSCLWVQLERVQRRRALPVGYGISFMRADRIHDRAIGAAVGPAGGS
ncbi:MAG: hypothetical protein DWI58_06120 [Chloroflexi bacterium]|nr:MAG: hypothetical protein DWI58_06120 [Chloroflexota bacterium]